MVRRRAAAAAVLIAAVGLTVTGTASSPALAAPRAAPPMIPAWRIVKQVHNGPFGGFSTVIAAGKNGGWAFNQGSVPTAWRRSGSTWTQVPFPGKSNETVVAAGATSPGDVWAFTARRSPVPRAALERPRLDRPAELRAADRRCRRYQPG